MATKDQAVTELPVTAKFCKALPKIELHAHLSGSISPQCLHEIWKRRKDANPNLELTDPLMEMDVEDGAYDVDTFFPLFSSYIYKLCSDLESIKYSTRSVLEDFEADGVRYLELRTTPRAIPAESISKELYVKTILDEIRDFTQDTEGKEPIAGPGPSPEEMGSRQGWTDPRVYLILSIDRRNSYEEAMEVVELARRYKTYRQFPAVVGIDLCGDPSKGDVSIFADAFQKARLLGFKTTVHFAEIPASSTRKELESLLSFSPDRLGHVIHVPEDLRAEIARRRLGLELCLSCNVKAKMVQGGFEGHHFGEWMKRDGHIILGTDDVGVFGSRLSNEYLLAAKHFHLSRSELIKLSQKGIRDIFGPERVKRMFNIEIRRFEKRVATMFQDEEDYVVLDKSESGTQES